MKLYLATSPRNLYMSVVRDGLSAAGHDIVLPEPYPFNSDLEGALVPRVNNAIRHGATDYVYDRNFDRMIACDAVVLMLPAPPVSWLEAGWFLGRQRPGVLYVPDGHFTPEIGYKLFERTLLFQVFGEMPVVVDTVDAVLTELHIYSSRANGLREASRRCGKEDE